MRRPSDPGVLSAGVVSLIFAASCADDRRQPDGLAPCLGVAATNQGGSTESGGGSGGTRGGSTSKGGTSSTTGGSSSRGGASGSSSGGTSSGSGGTSGDGGGGPTASCDLPWSEPVDTSECDLEALPPGDITLSGTIDDDLTLVSGFTYELDGLTQVEGATLTIEPCVKIVGTSRDTVLAIMPGAKIEAAGTEDRPIVFTSPKPPGERAPGDWGGLMLIGNARDNLHDGTTPPFCEGLATLIPYGSNTDEHDDESSGTLSYVRVEYVGRDLGGANESNGITFCGVGRGTTMHHVMVSNSIDDCFEWFGGTINASYLVALNCDDDMFDTDRGFSGTIQYAFGRQFESTPEEDSNGFEMDTGIGQRPKTSAKWSNVTLCGAHLGHIANLNPRLGMMLRRDAGGSIQNTIVAGFDWGAIAVQNLPETTITLSDSLVFENALVLDQLHQGGPDWFSMQAGNSDEAPEGFCDCWANPPVPFPIEPIAGGDTAGFPDDSAGFKGAFRDATLESNWMRGAWVDWSSE